VIGSQECDSQIAGNTIDFKMNIIKKVISYLCNVLHSEDVILLINMEIVYIGIRKKVSSPRSEKFDLGPGTKPLPTRGTTSKVITKRTTQIITSGKFRCFNSHRFSSKLFPRLDGSRILFSLKSHSSRASKTVLRSW
jgi:hypothetical protein